MPSGGIAGFPMPLLRYFVVSPDQMNTDRSSANTLLQLSPEAKAVQDTAQAVTFSWIGFDQVKSYRLELVKDDEEILAAIINKGATQYTAPPWIAEQVDTPLRWRVIAFDSNGKKLVRSNWRSLTLRTGESRGE